MKRLDNLAQAAEPFGAPPATPELVAASLPVYDALPVRLGRRFTLNPMVIFTAQTSLTWHWGVPGALPAVPPLLSITVV